MTVNRTTLLDLPVITTGTESGVWGDYTNNGLTQYLDIAIGGISSLTSANFSTGALTIETTEGTNSGTNIVASSAQYATFRVSSLAQNSTITVGNTGASLGRSYRLINDDSTYTLTFKATGQTGVTLQPGQTALVAYDGTDYKLVGTIGPTVPVARGGTNATATPTAGAVAYGTGSAYAFTAAGTAGYVLQSNGSSAPTWVAASTGTVTAVSVTTSNGFAGSSSGGATPALTLSTTISGVLKGNGTAISAASAGTDYLAPPSGTSILKANSGGALANATAGTDYVAPGTATTFTALQTFSGSSSVAAVALTNAKEVATVSATAATGTINYDVTTQSVLYYTSNASANWTVNFRGSSGTSLNTLMATGESVTVAFLVTQGATAYYNSAVQVDGSSVTPKYQGGTAWSAGNASSIDAYVYTIVKTGSAAFTVFASQTRFA